MAVTILSRHPETYTHYVVPKAHGCEDRDVRAFPLPPNAQIALVRAVIDELRSQGHTVTAEWKRERLVDWTATHRANDRSFCSDEDWRPNPKGPTLLHFVQGGWWGQTTCDGRVVTLEAQHLRMGRAGLRLVIAGHP